MEIVVSTLLLIAVTLALGFGYKLGGIQWLGVVPKRVELEKVIGVEASATGAELLLFTTELCSKCPQVRRNLEAASLGYAEVDVSNRLDLAAKFQIKQTPTLLQIGQDGSIIRRISGAITKKQISELNVRETANATN